MFWPILGFIGSVVAGIIVALIYQHKQKEKITNYLINILTKKGYKVSVSKTKQHDYIIESEKKLYLVKLIMANNRNEIVMANAQRWYLNAMRDSTKASKNIRIASEIVPLVTYDVTSNKELVKVFLIYPGAGKIVKYVNESEIIFVTPKINCWNYKVINYGDIEEHFDEL